VVVGGGTGGSNLATGSADFVPVFNAKKNAAEP
jgi:hypothetical protein